QLESCSLFRQGDDREDQPEQQPRTEKENQQPGRGGRFGFFLFIGNRLAFHSSVCDRMDLKKEFEGFMMQSESRTDHRNRRSGALDRVEIGFSLFLAPTREDGER